VVSHGQQEREENAKKANLKAEGKVINGTGVSPVEESLFQERQ